ncbi:ABC transporter ATP-binding protein [Geomicrobium sp. JCM 19039]|uniref:ABC transporter ATP-binding protein n=1 Tax=Geomicrobium sp. JCM 19039 TaxID=1460636 RepID=UPI00045F16CA|nr:ABC transporter ATP-binding protein [Geomicrobium sp. JCM 19039]GAK13541.1 lipid A export ATP-binding/permease protein MsbA [Geomicrobium sp. JCM 19039]
MKNQDFKKQWGTLKRLLGYLRPYRFRLLAVAATSVLSTLFIILGPFVLGLAITTLFEGTVNGSGIDFFQVGQVLLGLAALYLFSVYFSYIQEYLMVGVAQRVTYTLRHELHDQLMKLPITFFDRVSTGDLMSRGVNDLDKISSTLQQTITQTITAVMTMIGVVVMMLIISPLLTLIVCITLPISILITKRVIGYSQVQFRKQQQALGTLNGYVEESYTNHSLIQAYHQDESMKSKFKHHNTSLYEANWRSQFLSGLIVPLLNLLNNIIYVVIAIIGGIFVVQRTIAIGDVQALIMYIRIFTQPINRVANITNTIQATIASAERVFQIIDLAMPNHTNGTAVPEGHGEISFKHVSFQYDANKPVLKDINVKLEAGEDVAIVGASGAGKTTLALLLLRFYEANEGSVSIDGLDIRTIQEDALRRQTSIVMQDPWLFSGTIRENITFGRPLSSEDDMITAAVQARADAFIRKLPNGYDTHLDEQASGLSEGEKQLLSIARVMLSDPRILILDEATSNVDSRTELQIQKGLQQLKQGRTTVTIAHRLHTIQNADRILVMQGGQIVEDGAHETLVHSGTHYRQLFKRELDAAKEF